MSQAGGYVNAVLQDIVYQTVFYEILVGRRAFERDNEKKVIDTILREIAPIATELDRDIPMVVSQIVRKMLAKKPDRRFDNRRDVIETLKKAGRR